MSKWTKTFSMGVSMPNAIPEPEKCRHLLRDLEYCNDDAIITIPYGLSGIGACRKHIGSVVLWAMQTERGGLPDHQIKVLPTWQWADHLRWEENG